MTARRRAVRLAVLCAVGAILCLASGTASAVAGAAPDRGTVEFEAVRHGEPIGRSVMRFSESGGRLSVQVAVDIAVKIAMITVYRWDYRETETWDGPRLASLTARTDDDGTVTTVSARAEGGGLALTVNNATTHIAGDAAPVSFWDSAMLRAAVLFDPVTGAVLHPRVRELASSLPGARHYRIDAENGFAREVWYDAAGHLVQIRLWAAKDGSEIDYRLVSSPKGGPSVR